VAEPFASNLNAPGVATLSFFSKSYKQTLHMEELMPAGDDAPPMPDDDEDADDCICGMKHLEEPTTDEALPSASGGIETSGEGQQGNEDDVDGCELDFTAVEQTEDKELPVAVGGS
jgi:hypothetical protein